ncbi:Protein of unknown function DUF761 [Macleaya cordata]|uniref:DUF4408 domain-containing protein n=1 Tax=Macleaya cordata TaxID=56857 RepID=A0A200QV10_MACCD|nr:Protein of unknown function DUF761 [Macleaya cordata]
MGGAGKKDQRDEEMRTEMTEKKKQHEERETAMAALGLVLLVAGAKHAFASLVQQWRPLLVFLLLNLILLAILFTSMRSNNSNENQDNNNNNKKKIKMMMKKKRSMSTTSRSNSSSSSWSSSPSSSSSVHQVLEDYFCKISDHQEDMTSNPLAGPHQQELNNNEVGGENPAPIRTPTAQNHNLSNNNNNSKQQQQQQQQEDINARVEAFIVMFRQQLALDALQQGGMRRRSESTLVSRGRRTDDQTRVSFEAAQRQRPIH